MIRTLAFLAIVASAFGNDPWIRNKIHTKFDPIFGFNEQPSTVAEALKASFIKVEEPPTPLSSGYADLELYLSESNNYLIGLYFDETEKISGVLLNLPVAKVTPYYNITEQGLTSWTYNDEEYYGIRMYFVSEDKQTRIDSANSTDLLRDDYVTLQGLNGSVDKVPITATAIAAHEDWFKEACIIMMGQHYYYKMTPTLTCDTPFHPWFPLADEKTDQLTGMGFMMIGKNECELENPALAAVKMIVPTAPQCMYDLVEENGASTYHIYFVNHPRLMSC